MDDEQLFAIAQEGLRKALTAPLEDFDYFSEEDRIKLNPQIEEVVNQHFKIMEGADLDAKKEVLLVHVLKNYGIVKNEEASNSDKGMAFIKALGYAEGILRLDLDDPNSYVLMGTLYFPDASYVPLSVRLYRRAIQLDPENITAHLNIGTVLHYFDLAGEAIPFLQKAVDLEEKLNPNNKSTDIQEILKLRREIHRDLGICYFSEGKLEKALPYFQKAFDTNPHDPDVKQYLAACQKTLNIARIRRQKPGMN